MARKPYINWAIKRVTRSLQVLWPRSRTNIFGSSATGLSLPSSDVDLVVCLPPVRNLEPIKEAGILEGRNGIKETCLQVWLVAQVMLQLLNVFGLGRSCS
jgi:DNA polymerase sigma